MSKVSIHTLEGVGPLEALFGMTFEARRRKNLLRRARDQESWQISRSVPLRCKADRMFYLGYSDRLLAEQRLLDVRPYSWKEVGNGGSQN